MCMFLYTPQVSLNLFTLCCLCVQWNKGSSCSVMCSEFSSSHEIQNHIFLITIIIPFFLRISLRSQLQTPNKITLYSCSRFGQPPCNFLNLVQLQNQLVKAKKRKGTNRPMHNTFNYFTYYIQIVLFINEMYTRITR